jgi:hypothetical protein
VLVSGDSDTPTPAGNSLTLPNAKMLLTSPLLLHWYAHNCDTAPADLGPKFSCQPLGLSQWETQREEIVRLFKSGVGLVNGVLFNASQERRPSRPLLSAFNWETNPTARKALKDSTCLPAGQLANLSYCGKFPVQSLLGDAIPKSKFVLSPPGAGRDCYRTYEALLLGSFPVVLAWPPMDEMYNGLPVVVVQSWDAVADQAVVDAMFEELSTKAAAGVYDYRRLYAGYWHERFRSHTPGGLYREYSFLT